MSANRSLPQPGGDGSIIPKVLSDFTWRSNLGFTYNTLPAQLAQQTTSSPVRYQQKEAFPHPDGVSAEDWSRSFNSADSRIYNKSGCNKLISGKARKESYQTRQLAEEILAEKLGVPTFAAPGVLEGLAHRAAPVAGPSTSDNMSLPSRNTARVTASPAPSGGVTAAGSSQGGPSRSGTSSPQDRRGSTTARQGPGPSPLENVSSPDDSDGGEYCYCKGPDDHTPMVQCEKCDNWYHDRCLDKEFAKRGDPKSYKIVDCHELINEFTCAHCSPTGTDIINFVMKCALEGCQRRARTDRADGAKWCSDEHQLAHYEALARSVQASEIASGGKQTLGGQLKLAELASLLNQSETAKEFGSLGNDAPKLEAPGTSALRFAKMMSDLRDRAYDKVKPVVTKDETGSDVPVTDASGEAVTEPSVSTKYRTMEGWTPEDDRATLDPAVANWDWEALLNWEEKEIVINKMIDILNLRDTRVGYEAVSKLVTIIRNRQDLLLADYMCSTPTPTEKVKGADVPISEICGYDRRVVWTPEQLYEYRATAEGKEAFSKNTIGADPKPAMGSIDNFYKGVCVDKPTREKRTQPKQGCRRHVQWLGSQLDDAKQYIAKCRAAEEKIQVYLEEMHARAEFKEATKETDCRWWYRTTEYYKTRPGQPLRVKKVLQQGPDWYFELKASARRETFEKWKKEREAAANAKEKAERAAKAAAAAQEQ